AVINMECIAAQDRERVREELSVSGKQIIEITQEQMERFAGNMLQVYSSEGRSYLVMSSQAYHSLEPRQIEEIERFDSIIHSALETIESNGGGSARCMMAEIYLQ